MAASARAVSRTISILPGAFAAAALCKWASTMFGSSASARPANSSTRLCENFRIIEELKAGKVEDGFFLMFFRRVGRIESLADKMSYHDNQFAELADTTLANGPSGG